MKWLRGPKMAIVWTVLRIWLGLQWTEAAIEKLTHGFDALGFLQGALANAKGDHPSVQGWYANFLQHFAIPNVELFNHLIPIGELLVGIGLILGVATIPALITAAFMNLNFMLAGTTSTNPILYTIEILLIAAGTAGYYYGMDRIIIPKLKNWMHDKKVNRKHHAPAS